MEARAHGQICVTPLHFSEAVHVGQTFLMDSAIMHIHAYGPS